MRSKLMLTATLLLLLAVLIAQLWSGQTQTLQAGDETPPPDGCAGDLPPTLTPTPVGTPPPGDDPELYLPIVLNSAETTASKHEALLRGGVPIEIAIGDVVNHTVDPSDTCIVYLFDASAGQSLFFDAQQVDGNNIDWTVQAPDSTVLFDTCMTCRPPTPDLDQTGTYTLTIGAVAGSYQFQIWDIPDPQHFNITVGDIVSPDQPATGAGNIESPGAVDVYTFAGFAGHAYFFDIQNTSGTDTTRWMLETPFGTEVFEDCLSCSDKGPLTFTDSGTYTLTVGSRENAAYGSYQLQVSDVSVIDQFDINIGDSVGPDQPGPGAGHIEAPGVLDVYNFDAVAGEIVFFQMETVTHTGSLAWHLEDSLGPRLFDDCLVCGSPGAIELEQGGAYTITVGRADQDTTGTYEFALIPVTPPDLFAISIGDVVSDGNPGPGAGNIEVFGARDIYTFEATAGQVAFFEIHSVTGGLAVRWLLEDSNGSVLFVDCLACGNPGQIPLDVGGTYTITVGTVDSTTTGTYQFQLSEIRPDDQFDIEIGDVVSDGVPGPGAGNIEGPGTADIYNFTATAGQTVNFEGQAFSSGLTARWQLNDSTGARLFRRCLGCSQPGDVQLSVGGTYTITVSDDFGGSSGTYQFQTLNQP